MVVKQTESPKPSVKSPIATFKLMEIDEGCKEVNDVSKQRERSLTDVTNNSLFNKMLTNSNSPRAQFQRA